MSWGARSHSSIGLADSIKMPVSGSVVRVREAQCHREWILILLRSDCRLKVLELILLSAFSIAYKKTTDS